MVEEFDSPAFHAALRQTARKWGPALAQLEFTQMAQYAPDCAPAPTLLVEHDITFDLYEQLLRLRRRLGDCGGNWSAGAVSKRRPGKMSAAWSRCRKRTGAWLRAPARGDARKRSGSGAIPPRGRGARTESAAVHRVARAPAERAGAGFFVNEVWPLLDPLDPTLHVIAGMRHEYFLEFYKDRATVDLSGPGIEVEGFVADVRPAYERAAIVIAPLMASAGTNIKILEAMAMGKAIVSTPAGVNGLDWSPAPMWWSRTRRRGWPRRFGLIENPLAPAGAGAARPERRRNGGSTGTRLRAVRAVCGRTSAPAGKLRKSASTQQRSAARLRRSTCP